MKRTWRKVVMGILLWSGLHLSAAAWAKATWDEEAGKRGVEFARGLERVGSFLQQLRAAGGGQAGAAQVLTVNGARVRLHSGSIPASQVTVSELVERAQAQCRKPLRGEGQGLLSPPVVTWSTEGEAVVYCLKPERALSWAGISASLARFESSRDLSEWGVFQGAYFRASGDAVSILTAEVLGGLVPERMFPESDDSPGSNFRELPKPAGRRVLSVAHREDVALTIHQGRGSGAQLLDEYHLRLIEAGLSVECAEESRVPGGDVNVRAQSASPQARALLVRSARESFIVVASDAASGGQLTIARLPH